MRIAADGTMFAALYGELAAHPQGDPHVAAPDAYSLFVARSSAMEWLADAGVGMSHGVWGMNDAGQDAGSGGSGALPARVAWFQVSLARPVRTARPLPVQAFLACVADVVARLGTLRLDAVQLLLPVQCTAESASGAPGVGTGWTLLQDAGWFIGRDPRLRTPVRVTVDGGQDATVRTAAPDLLRVVRDVTQEVFTDASYSLTDHDDLAMHPPIIDELWLGPPQHRVTFRGTLTEWSLDAIAWLAAFLASVGRQCGVRTPLLLTARPVS